MPSNPDYEDGQRSDMDKIADFLNTFAPNHQENKPIEKASQRYSFKEMHELERLTNEDYLQVFVPSEIEMRIEKLKRVTDIIEQKVEQTENLAIVPPAKEYKIDYQKSLNKNQYVAATSIKGPLLVIAGAGSGKTRTVVYRTSFLLENNILPESILLLTFTRKAAKEIIERTARLLQDNSVEKIMRGTYHAFANHTLRLYSKMLDLPTNFTIIDTIDAQDTIDLIRQELKFAKKSKAFPRKNRIQSIISKARNCNISIVEVLEREYTALLEFEEDINVIAKTFQQYKRANQLLDYDDLMEVLRDKLRDNMAFRRSIQAKYRYIMVDEFQDTNVVQKQIIDYIAAGSQNIMIVGDDTQSIYAFRGANFENILMFPATYPNCKVVKLTRNYRSNQDILNFTNSIANQAILGYKKSLYSENHTPFRPIAVKQYDQQQEAEFIVSKIMELREKDIPLNKIAVLYRASYHGTFIQAELLKRQIPYVVVGGIRFVERRHVKDITSYLRILLNPYDAVAWNRILKLIPGIGKVTASKIILHLQKQNGQIDFSKFDKRKYGTELLNLQEVMKDAMRETISISTKIEILKAYYEPLLKTQEADYELRLQDIDVLVTLAGKYDSLEKFLSDFALDPPSNRFQDQNRPLIDESEDKPVTLSTIHSAKGLEWYCVFVPHLLDGLFPSSRSLKTIDYLEEERRLFYVACSRAKEQLYLTYPSYFTAWDSYLTMPSRFLVEVEDAFYKILEP
ncbi:MAG: ATP-dependent helicase [Chitinophagales bacterium]